MPRRTPNAASRIEIGTAEARLVYVLDLAELAVARRGEVVAHVSAAADLNDEQRSRLTEVLTRIYAHPVSVQLHITETAWSR